MSRLLRATGVDGMVKCNIGHGRVAYGKAIGLQVFGLSYDAPNQRNTHVRVRDRETKGSPMRDCESMGNATGISPVCRLSWPNGRLPPIVHGRTDAGDLSGQASRLSARHFNASGYITQYAFRVMHLSY